MKRILLSLSILLISVSNYAQPDPCEKKPDTNTFSAIIDSQNAPGQYNDFGYSGIQDSQTDEYIICGESYAYDRRDVFVNHLDNIGNLGPSMICFRPDKHEGSRWMNETHVATNPLPTGGYFYTGSAGKTPETDLLFKATDKFGNLVSATIYDPANQGNEIGHSVIQNNAGGYVAVGERLNHNGMISAYAVGLDNTLTTTWVMDYLIDGFAWSVVELPYQLDPEIRNMYAVTGMHGNRVFVMFINGANGMIVPWLPIFTYDLDSNPETNEVGHSINVDPFGDIIVTGSANKTASSQGVPQNQIFIFKIPRENIAPGVPGLGNLSMIQFYDIPNSINELARHIIATENNSYVVTGRAYSKISSSTQIETGEAFIMSVRDNGVVQWINNYTDPNHLGSKGERVEQTKDGGYYMTGSIWGEDPSGATSQGYDKFAIKTDQLGRLNTCDCCRPEVVFMKDSQWSKEFLQIEVREDEIPPHADFIVEQVDVKASYCDQYVVPAPCDIFTTATIDNSIDTCCVVKLDLTNNMTSVYQINVQVITPGVSFDLATVNTSLGLQINPPGTNPFNIRIESNPVGNPIPMGILNDFVTFCYEGVSTNQTIIITYYDQFGHLILECRDIIQTDCEVDDNDDECVELNILEVECDSLRDDKFKLYFSVTNNDPLLTIGTLTLFNAGPPILILPSSVTISPPVVGIGTSTVHCVDIIASGPFPMDIFLTYTMTDFMNMQCCSNQDSLQIELPNCCSPCDDPQDGWVDIGPTDENNCCYNIDIFNPCDYTLTKIQTEIVTPGVSFSSASVGAGYGGSWTVSGGLTIKDYIPNTIPAPSGNYFNLIEFCLDNPGNVLPQELLVHYYISDGMGGESILCTERFFLECVQPTDCLDIVHHKVFCDKETGRYYLDFWIENVSPSFIADRLEILVADPYDFQFNVTPALIYPITLNPGDTYCDVVEITGSPTPAAGDFLEIEFQIHKHEPYDCCEEIETIGVTLPECCEGHHGQAFCCDDLAVTSTKNQGCCFQTDLTNNYSSNVSQVLASFITPGREFSSVIPQGSYTAPWGPSFININHPGQIPFGTSTAFDFCITPTVPVSIWGYSSLVEYRWVEQINNQSVIICTDTITYWCGLIDISIDPDICISDVIKPSDLGDACINVTTLPDQRNEDKSGVVIEVLNTDVAINEIVANSNALWDQPVVENRFIYIDFKDKGPSNSNVTSIVDICFSEIPANGIDLDIHWLQTDAAGNLTRCAKSRTIKDCEDDGNVSGQSIESGVYHFDDTLESNGIINPNNAVQFKAGNTVNLIGGFEIRNNSILEVSIEDCLDVIER